MGLGERLEAAVGKNIDKICENKFHDAAANHCAHFASHMCDIDFEFTCRGFMGGNGAAANIRVHELFAQCPAVGKWENADLSKPQLAFITRKDVVDLANKRMGNIPQKHVGVYFNGFIYHYGNTADKVVKDSPQAFREKFQRLYAGDQGLYFGRIPGGDLRLNVHADGARATAERAFDIPDPVDGRWKARLTGEPEYFLVGKEIRDQGKGYYGLFTPVREYWGPEYRGDDYFTDLDHWAYLLEATGACESENRFVLTNTYDRAKFTFGFYQLAAHTPRDNLILLFHRLAKLDRFKAYFPDLEIIGGRLHRVDKDGSRTDLEAEFFDASHDSHQLQLFMNYLNPARWTIDRQEALQAARLMHWAVDDPAARRAQVLLAADIIEKKMAERYSRKLPLDGKSDIICTVVADILHQGRGSYATIRTALQQPQPLRALLAVGSNRYASRSRRLEAAITFLKAAGKLGRKRYNAAKNLFE